jgi:divalent metal cation (Fe/Co/Zn/Cd) transporter
VQSIVVLLARFHPRTSPVGIAWLVLTAAAMFLLAYGKGRTGRQLGNPVLQKESRVTVVDGLLAVAVLVGLILDAVLGWWWADPLAASVIVYYGLREGMATLRNEGQ